VRKSNQSEERQAVSARNELVPEASTTFRPVDLHHPGCQKPILYGQNEEQARDSITEIILS